MLHADQAIETILVTLEFVVVRDEQFFAETILARQELPTAVGPFTQQRRCEVEVRVLVAAIENLRITPWRQPLQGREKSLYILYSCDDVLFTLRRRRTQGSLIRT